MTADARQVAVTTAPSLPSRLLGLGSVYGKSIRDGRRGGLVVGFVAGLMMFVTAGALVAEWPTLADRNELIASMALLPDFLRNLLGEPIRIETLGGFMSWRIGNLLPVILGVWSVLVLSGTLAIEARRGSLDLVASTPVGRARIAFEKVAGHVTLVVVAMAIATVAIWLCGTFLGTIPEDAIPLANAVGHTVLTGLLMLAPGALAFAVAPVLGRGRAAGLGFLVLFGGYILQAYRSLSDFTEALTPLSIFSWTAGHRPLAGQWDWPAVGLLAAVTVVLLAIGVVAFVRRDIGSSIALRGPGISLPAGTSGPFLRRLTDRMTIAVAAGLGIGAYGLMIAASADQFAEGIGQMPGIKEMIARIYPGVDISDPAGLLQLAFFAFGALLISIAAAAFVHGLAADETDGRLDQILAAPLSRRRWFVSSGLGALAGLVVVSVVVIALISIGVVANGGGVDGPIAGGAILALYGGAFAGIGFAVAGLGRPGLAAGVTAGIAISSYVLGVLGNALQLPDWLVDLALSEHVGQPMAGVFDPVGIALMAVLAFGGLAVGAWGFGRRDINR